MLEQFLEEANAKLAVGNFTVLRGEYNIGVNVFVFLLVVLMNIEDDRKIH